MMDTTKAKYMVFISSMFDSLRDERRRVVENILTTGHIPLGMELFPQTVGSLPDYLQKAIDVCDIFLLILNEDYGKHRSGERSYTEQEYEYAISQSKTCLFYLQPEGQLEDKLKHLEETPSKSPELLDVISRLREAIAFQDRVRNYCHDSDRNRRWNKWHNALDLGEQVSRDLLAQDQRPGWVRVPNLRTGRDRDHAVVFKDCLPPEDHTPAILYPALPYVKVSATNYSQAFALGLSRYNGSDFWDEELERYLSGDRQRLPEIFISCDYSPDAILKHAIRDAILADTDLGGLLAAVRTRSKAGHGTNDEEEDALVEYCASPNTYEAAVVQALTDEYRHFPATRAAFVHFYNAVSRVAAAHEGQPQVKRVLEELIGKTLVKVVLQRPSDRFWTVRTPEQRKSLVELFYKINNPPVDDDPKTEVPSIPMYVARLNKIDGRRKTYSNPPPFTDFAFIDHADDQKRRHIWDF